MKNFATIFAKKNSYNNRHFEFLAVSLQKTRILALNDELTTEQAQKKRRIRLTNERRRSGVWQRHSEAAVSTLAEATHRKIETNGSKTWPQDAFRGRYRAGHAN